MEKSLGTLNGAIPTSRRCHLLEELSEANFKLKRADHCDFCQQEKGREGKVFWILKGKIGGGRGGKGRRTSSFPYPIRKKSCKGYLDTKTRVKKKRRATVNSVTPLSKKVSDKG